MYRLCSDWEDLRGKPAFIFVEDDFRIERRLFKMVETVLKDLQCFSTIRSKPRFGGICIVLSGD